MAREPNVTDQIDLGDIRSICDTDACRNARIALQLARNRITMLCDVISERRRAKEALFAIIRQLAVVITTLLVVAAMMLTAYVVGWIAAAVMLALIAAYVVAILSLVARGDAIGKQISRLLDDLDTANGAFDAAVTRVMEACPSSCISELMLSRPRC